MARFDSLGAFLRVVTVFFTYSVAVQATEPLFDSLYLRTGAALLATLVAVLAIDAVPALLRGKTPTFGEGSFFYSGRGILIIIVLLLLTGAFADGLRAGFELPEWLAVGVAVVGAGVLVFGSLVAYYWRRRSRALQVG